MDPKNQSPRTGQTASQTASLGNPTSGGSETHSLRMEGERGKPFVFTFNGEPISAFEGETIAAALMGSGIRALRLTEREAQPRGLFCNMGVCFDCLVEVDGRPNQRACQVPVAEGIQVKSQHPKDPLER